jgi:hypothetical protein
LPPVGKKVVEPVRPIVKTTYEPLVVRSQIARSLEGEMNANKLGTERGIFYDQPSENADSRKSKREKEKHLQCYYAGRLGGSLTRLDGTYVVRRPSLCFGTGQLPGLAFRKCAGFRRWNFPKDRLLN